MQLRERIIFLTSAENQVVSQTDFSITKCVTGVQRFRPLLTVPVRCALFITKMHTRYAVRYPDMLVRLRWSMVSNTVSNRLKSSFA
jgi:hypothetical protein